MFLTENIKIPLSVCLTVHMSVALKTRLWRAKPRIFKIKRIARGLPKTRQRYASLILIRKRAAMEIAYISVSLCARMSVVEKFTDIFEVFFGKKKKEV